jgi:hypothetical protein
MASPISSLFEQRIVRLCHLFKRVRTLKLLRSMRSSSNFTNPMAIFGNQLSKRFPTIGVKALDLTPCRLIERKMNPSAVDTTLNRSLYCALSVWNWNIQAR